MTRYSRATLLFILVFLLVYPSRLVVSESRLATAPPDEYTVAVLSPTEGPLRDVGSLHDESIKRALQLREEKVRLKIGGKAITVLFRGTGNPLADSSTCNAGIDYFVQREDVVAILGPVSSNCTRDLLSDSLRVPVISSLSTAKDLGAKNEWFFRTIAHDQRRVETFVDTARSHGVDIENSIAIYKPTVYGKGLLDHVQTLIPSVDSAHSFRWNEAIQTTSHDVAVTDSFRSTMQHHHEIANVFVLGTSDRMPAVLDAVRGAINQPDEGTRVSLVGSTRYRSDFPPKTWLIGEPRVRTSQNLITELQKPSVSGDLHIASMDAAIAVEEALRTVFTGPDTSNRSLSSVREELRKVLEQNRFRSAERGRSISFSDGEIRNPANTPLYRTSVEQYVENLNRPDAESWVQVDVIERPKGHLEGPVVVELTPRGEDLFGKTVTLQVNGIADKPVPLEEVRLKRHGTRVSFAPSFFRANLFPTSLSVGTSETPVAERASVDNLGWPVSYLLAALLALIGAGLYAQYQERRSSDSNSDALESWTWWTYGERSIAGLVIAFLVIHLAPLLETGPLASIPIPQFGASSWVNAVVSGLLGGWLGLNPIVGLVASVISALTPLFQS